MTSETPARPSSKSDWTGLPIVAACVLLLLASPAALLGLLPVPDVDTVEAHLRMDPGVYRPRTMAFLRALDVREIGELEAALDHEDAVVRAAAIRAHVRLGRATEEMMTAGLADTDEQVLAAALEVLSSGMVAPKRVPARVAEIALDRNRGMYLRWQALQALDERPDETVVAQRVLDVIFDPREQGWLRGNMPKMVRNLTAEDVTRLREVLGEGTAANQHYAAMALTAGAATSPKELVVPALVDAVASSNDMIVTTAAGALATLGPDARAAAPALRDAAVRMTAPNTRQAVLGALLRVGLDKDQLTPAFRNLSKDGHPQVRGQVQAIIQQAGRKGGNRKR